MSGVAGWFNIIIGLLLIPIMFLSDIDIIYIEVGIFIVGIINIMVGIKALSDNNNINDNSQKKLSDYTIKGGE